MVQSYLPLYRKYRPQSLPELVGQPVVSETLSNAIALNQVGHAYLFTGPRGTGKTSTARIFAKALNCVEGASPSPCQVCDSCMNITRGVDMDVVEFDAASNSGVEEARNLIESSQFAPIAGRYKIYIIDEVHMLSNAAFNVLLKTLEEPPPSVIFIFATTEAHKVLPTIVSRCQRFHFNRIATADIVERLQWVADQEALNLEAEALRYLARQARGGLRDALSSLDQVAILARSQPQPLSLKDTIRFLGQVDESASLDLLSHIATQNPKAVLDALQQLDKQGIEAPQVVAPLLQSLRFVLFSKAIAPTPVTAEAIETSEAVAQQVNTLANQFTPGQLAPIVSGLHQLEQEMKRSSDPSLTLETGLLSLTLKLNDASAEGLKHRIEALEAQLVRLSETMPPAAPAFASMPPPSGQYPPPLMPPSMPVSVVAPAGPPPYTPPVVVPSGMLPPPMSLPATPPLPPPSQAGVSVHTQGAAASHPLPNPNQDVVPVASSVSAHTAQVGRTIIDAIQSNGAKALFQQHTQLVSLEGQKITLRATNASILNMLQAPNRLKYYREAANAVLGVEATIAFETPASGGASVAVSPKKPDGGGLALPPASIRSVSPLTLQFETATPAIEPVVVQSPPPVLPRGKVDEEATAPTPLKPSPPLIKAFTELDAMASEVFTPFSKETLINLPPGAHQHEQESSAPPTLWEDEAGVATLQVQTATAALSPVTESDSITAEQLETSPKQGDAYLTMPPPMPEPPGLPTVNSQAHATEPSVLREAIHVNGKGQDWESAQGFVRNLLRASEVTALPDINL